MKLERAIQLYPRIDGKVQIREVKCPTIKVDVSPINSDELKDH